MPPAFARYAYVVRAYPSLISYLCLHSYDDALAKTCQALLGKLCTWNEQGCPDSIPLTSEDLKALTPAQFEEFLSQLLLAKPLLERAIVAMQTLYDFNNVQNAEIKFRYVLLSL